MLLEHYKANNCYPQFSRSFRKDAHAADGYQHFLITAQRKMREKFLRLTQKVNRTEIEMTFLNDIECLPGWHFPNLNFQPYIPGNDIGDEQRLCQREDALTLPFPDLCLLCGKGFACSHDLVEHCNAWHGNYKEYRKRVLFLTRETGLAKIPGQSKRAMIQNVAQFQTQCVPGLQANDWARLDNGVSRFHSRKEVACAVCARLEFLEQLESVFLFRENENLDPEHCCVVTAEGIDKILSVRRYASRWPLIPSTELHASSIIHPSYPHMRWLLHTRVVKIKKNSFGARGGSEEEPPTAGIADESEPVYLCQLCASNLCSKIPRMPPPALANDLWIGRYLPLFSSLTQAEKWLISLGRSCYRKVLLGRKGAPEEEAQKGLTGNSVFLAQPTAGLATQELPPSPDSLSDSLIVAFAGSNTYDLTKCQWALVRRNKYLEAATYRQKVCPAYTNVVVKHDVSQKNLPDAGVPLAIERCFVGLEEMEEVKQHFPGLAGVDSQVKTQGPDAGSEEDSGSEAPKEQIEESKGINESIIALNSGSELDPSSMFAAFQEKLNLLQQEAEKVIESEQKDLLNSGETKASCADEGGRQVCQQIIVDLQSAVHRLRGEAKLRIEAAINESSSKSNVTAQGLAVPTHGPLSWYQASTWPAVFPEFLYGDGAPGIEREKIYFSKKFSNF